MKKLNEEGFLIAIDIMINSWNTKVKVREFLKKKNTSYIEESQLVVAACNHAMHLICTDLKNWL